MEKGLKKRCYFILQTQITDSGEYIPCIAEEGTQGYFKTDWSWGSDIDIAESIADEKNDRMGISKKEALKIVAKSMATITRKVLEGEA